MTKFQFTGSAKVRRKVIRQYTVLATVNAYCALGCTVTAAIVYASHDTGVPPRTIASWRSAVRGIAFNDVAMQLRYLSWRNFKPLEGPPDAR